LSYLQYIDFLLKERKDIEEKIKTMNKAEMVQFGRQLIATYLHSLKGFDDWFTTFYIMEKMEPELIREIIRNLIEIGFKLLEYDRDVTHMWYEREAKERGVKEEPQPERKEPERRDFSSLI